MKEPSISICERNLIQEAVSKNKRTDGRRINDFRKVKVTYGLERGSCEVALGETKAFAQVTCEITLPKPARPNEGIVHMNVELSPMAAQHFEAGRQSTTGVELNRLLERCVIGSRCIDTESLCIVAGEKVWSIRVDVHILNHDGNLAGCASIAALSALMHFRRPDVTVSPEGVHIHSHEEREPLPLTVYHMPLCMTFAFYNQGEHMIMDATNKEELVMDGKMVLGVNAYKEVCTIHMSGKILLSKEKILQCSSIACRKVGEIASLIKTSISEDLEQRKSKAEVGFASLLLRIPTKPEGLPMEVDTEGLWQTVPTKAPKTLQMKEVVRMGPGTVSLGEQAPIIAWDVSDESEPEEPTSIADNPSSKTKEIETVNLDDDDSEEEVTILQPENYEKSSSNISNKGRKWYGQNSFL